MGLCLEAGCGVGAPASPSPNSSKSKLVHQGSLAVQNAVVGTSVAAQKSAMPDHSTAPDHGSGTAAAARLPSAVMPFAAGAQHGIVFESLQQQMPICRGESPQR